MYGKHLKPTKEDMDDVDLMVFKVHCTGAKLAGGLNHVASDCPPERGFVVAYLKRALALLHEALAALGRIEQSHILPELTPTYREELHALRVGILETMERYRAK